MQLRPRLFLEGNLFVDLRPGQPERRRSRRRLHDPDRPDLGLGPARPGADHAAVGRPQQPAGLPEGVRRRARSKYGGAEGFRELYRTSPRAYKYTAAGQPGAARHRAARPLRRDPQLRQRGPRARRPQRGAAQGPGHQLPHRRRLVRLRGPGARAARSSSCRSVLDAGKPAFANLNAAFPPLRAFAREALPGVRSTPARRSTPRRRSSHQLRAAGLASRSCAAWSHDLRPTIPQLAKLTKRHGPVPGAGAGARPAASTTCHPVVERHGRQRRRRRPVRRPVGPVYKETGYGLVGIAGESRSGDANGQYIRVAAGGGANTVVSSRRRPSSGLGRPPSASAARRSRRRAAHRATRRRPRSSPTSPCENQEPPNLDAGGSAPPPAPSRAERCRRRVRPTAARRQTPGHRRRRSTAHEGGEQGLLDLSCSKRVDGRPAAARQRRPQLELPRSEAAADGDRDPQAPA